MKSYRLLNISLGWFTFLVALITYVLTVEPTMSLWDCGEFIATAYKLEVGHPIGAPTFMILGRLFSLFAPDTSRVALTINLMSALASAFTIMFLFWTITHLARRIFINEPTNYSLSRIIPVFGAGLVGALAFTFSDTFWFSAVEGEVYGLSSLFTAITFWAILKWENEADQPYANRWLILIAYLVGLSIGVHLLNLLAIPAVIFVYYFKKFSFSWKGFIVSLILSVVLLALIMFGLVPGFMTMATKLELFLVNKLSLPYNSGIYLQIILFIVFVALALKATINREGPKKIAILASAALFFTGMWLLTDKGFLNFVVLVVITGVVWYMSEKQLVALNTILTSVVVIMIGYSSFATIMIRSSVNTPMDENNPETAFQMLYYLNREQYPKQPIITGPYYNAPLVSYDKGKPTYSPVDGKYVITNRAIVPKYDERFMTIFPRMYSDESDHIEVYKEWVPVRGTPIQVSDQNGEPGIVYKPTFGENLKFMFSYQLGYMYFRYFMWNFAGRQNDIQGTGGPFNGNWISGIKAIDEARVGPQDNLPESMAKDPSRNVYYFLPLLLGLAGLYYQLNRDVKNLWVVFLLFAMTGIAIVVYLNQYPNQPRERDYAYAASFYVFGIWIGMGVLFLTEIIGKVTGDKIAGALATVIGLIAAPLLMASQNWDDHDRSGRYTATDIAVNYLESCAPNAILFSNGDNDTFPLWYAQEVEGVRTDVRVCNLMLFNTDWYIDQMKLKTYDSEPMPISLPREKYYDGVNNQVYIIERQEVKGSIPVKQVVDFIRSNNPGTKYTFPDGEEHDYIPTRKIRIPVDSARVIASGTVKPGDAHLIVPYIDITLKGNWILKSQMMVLDFLAHNDWERPVYFVTGYHNDTFGLEEYFQLEGNAFRLVPIKSHNSNWLDYGRIDTDILYDNLMNKFSWGRAKEDDVYLGYYHTRTLTVIKARISYSRLAKALIEEGRNERAIEVLDHIMHELPVDKLPWDMYMPDIIDAYLMAGAEEKALPMVNEMKEYYTERLEYYTALRIDFMLAAEYEIQTSLSYLSRVAGSLTRSGNSELANELNTFVQEVYSEYFKRRQSVTEG